MTYRDMLHRIILIISAILMAQSACADEYRLSIQPLYSQEQVLSNYGPLARYLTREVGHQITLVTYRDYMTYWSKLKRGNGFDLVLDAAHFTDYRIKKKGYQVIARMPDTVSFSLVVTDENPVIDIEELINKKVATTASPSIGVLRLEQIFPDPVREPNYVISKDFSDVVSKLLDGSVAAGILPTRIVNRYENLNLVVTTEPLPHLGFSASPEVPREIVERIKLALITASDSVKGKDVLSKSSTEKFVAADNAMYDGYAELLEGVFGY